jgi:nitrogen fixation/metabolism regulation signal transduction histidine kinase
MDQKPNPRRKWLRIFLLFIVAALLILGWAPASLNLAFLQPETPQQTILLLAVYTVIFLAFVIFALILLRNLLKLYVERRQQRLGARFKTKMVAAFLGLSLVPVSFLFIFAYGLLNRSIDKWFGVPFDIVRQDAQEIFEQVQLQAERHALHDTLHLIADQKLAAALARRDAQALERLVASPLKRLSLEAVICYDTQGRVVARGGNPWPGPPDVAEVFPQLRSGGLPAEGIATHWQRGETDVFLAASPVTDGQGRVVGSVVSAARLPTGVGEVRRPKP